MNYGIGSPSDCAKDILDKVSEELGENVVLRSRVDDLARQCIRNMLEQCAMLAEDYVVVHDPCEELTGMEVGDAIAEQIRQIADERSSGRDDRAFLGLRIKP